MDSANSGSLQSSSGGDEEYESNPGFFNPSFPHLSNLQNPFPLFPHQQNSLFDPNNSHNFPQSFSQSSQNPNFGASQINLAGKQPEKPLQIGSNQAPAAQSVNLRPTGGGGSSQAPGVVKNPKKRTRASRRAPTTVLTTDTSNFRAMVQEFTGIPAPPFAASPYTRRLDLFGSGLRSNGSNLDPISASGLYPLRPSAQKINQSPILFNNSSSSSSSSPLMNSNLVDSSNKSTTGDINYQISSESQNLLNLQNQMFSFQSLLPSSSVLQSSFSVPLKSQFPLSSVGEIGSGQGRVNGDFGNNNDQDQLRSLDGCKLNNSSSDFQHQKGLENVPPRGEGIVDSWICPSD